MRVRVPPSAQNMLTLFHQFEPQAILFNFTWININWYGLFVVTAIISAMTITRYFWKKENLDLKLFDDFTFFLVISGLIGARVYEWFLNFNYYFSNLGELFKVWHGGLAIHGAIFSSCLFLLIFAKKQKIEALRLISVVVPGLALGQAIGRWGNYFNQELFGLPTNLPWGIFISQINRPINFTQFSYFHPTFLYESLLCIILFIVLFFLKRNKVNHNYIIVATYFIGYGIIRFFLEFIKIDQTPELFGLRFPQIISLLMIIIGLLFIYEKYKKNEKGFRKKTK